MSRYLFSDIAGHLILPVAEYNHWNNLTEIATMKQTFPVYRTRKDKLDINGNHPSELIATFELKEDAEFYVKVMSAGKLKHYRLYGAAYIGVNGTTRLGRGT